MRGLGCEIPQHAAPNPEAKNVLVVQAADIRPVAVSL